MAAHRYYRLNIASTVGAGVSYVAVRDMQLAASVGGANLALTGNGTASASMVDAANVAANAFDGNVDTMWQANHAGVFPQWLQWDFGVNVVIAEVRLSSVDGVNYNSVTAPKDGTVQWSDDGTTWAIFGTFAGFTGAVGSVQTITVPIPWSADLVLPMLTLGASFGGAADSLALPMLTLDASFGGAADSLALPMLTLDAVLGGLAADLALPMLTLDAAGHDTTGENAFEGVLPMLTLDASFGGAASVVLPMLALDAAMTGTTLIQVDLTLPMLTLDAAGVGSPYVVTADFAIPMLALEAYFGGGAEMALPLLTLDAAITAGGLLTADLTIPMLRLDAAGVQQSYGSIVLTLPMLVPMASATVDLLLPMLQLDAAITAVVTVTYEAYAINLNHTAEGHDEMTRYTNFPFTHIVRYQGSYFGVSATGLYLLKGTTDHAVPPTAIPWDFKTAIGDFNSPLKKTIVSAYFSGRLGPTERISLYAGEKNPVAYSYKNPRGDTAQNYRQVFGRGIKDRYYALGASGSGTLALDGVEFNIAEMTRRI